MASKEKTRMPSAIQNGNGGAGAFAVCVKVVTAFNAVLTVGAFALSVAWGLALPAAAFAAMFAVSAFMLKGGAA